MSNPFYQEAQQSGNGGLQLPPFLATKARGLKILLISELILTLWVLFLGVGLLPVLVIVPTNIIGFYGLAYLRRNLLTVFVFCKTVIACLVIIIFVEYASAWIQCENCGSMGGQIPTLTIILLLILTFQIVCIATANKIRTALLNPLPTLRENVELGQVDVDAANSGVMGQSQQPAVPYGYAQYTPYPVPPQFMQQGAPQGYPVYSPQFGYAPNASGAPQQQQGMAAVYPTYAYPDPSDPSQAVYPTYTVEEAREPAEPTEKDSDSLLSK